MDLIRRSQTMPVMCLALAACGTQGRTTANTVASRAPSTAADSTAGPLREKTPARVTRTLLERRDVPGAPGFESRIYVITFPPGVAAPPHVHTAQGTGYVIEGTFESSFDDGPVTTKHSGEAFVDLPGKTHHFRNADPLRPLRFTFSGTFPKSAPIFRDPSATVRFDGGDPARTIHKAALYPETIDFDPTHGTFVVGSFRDGAIYRVDDQGHTTRFADDRRLTSTLGIAVDAAHGRLWAVSADVNASVRRSSAGPKRSADLVALDLATGTPLFHVDLSGLVTGTHLLNGVAVDGPGNAYVTDSFSGVIYRITGGGEASVFARDPRFASPAIGLNGLIVHPHGFLLVVKKSDGAIFKVPLTAPARASQVKVEGAFVGADGLTLVGDKDLVIVANATPTAKTNAAFALATDDDWTTARVYDVLPLGDDYPTTAVVRDRTIFVLSTGLDSLLRAAAAGGELADLRAEATLRPIGSVAR